MTITLDRKILDDLLHEREPEGYEGWKAWVEYGNYNAETGAMDDCKVYMNEPYKQTYECTDRITVNRSEFHYEKETYDFEPWEEDVNESTLLKIYRKLDEIEQLLTKR